MVQSLNRWDSFFSNRGCLILFLLSVSTSSYPYIWVSCWAHQPSQSIWCRILAFQLPMSSPPTALTSCSSWPSNRTSAYLWFGCHLSSFMLKNAEVVQGESGLGEILDASDLVVVYEKTILTQPQLAQFGSMEVVNALDRDNATSPEGSFHQFRESSSLISLKRKGMLLLFSRLWAAYRARAWSASIPWYLGKYCQN